MFPKNRNLGSRAVFSNWALIDLIFGWSGATPERTRPHGVGSISSMSTRTSASSVVSANFSSDAAAKYPEGPEPTIATWYGRIPDLHRGLVTNLMLNVHSAPLPPVRKNSPPAYPELP